MALRLRILLFFVTTIQYCLSFQLFRDEVIVNSSELTVFTLTPSMFNWADDVGNPGLRKQIEYIARISNSPDLPTWLQFTYDGVTSTAHLYGVPPRDVGTIDIDVIARNRNQSFDVRQLILTFTVIPQPEMEFVVEFKIDNMNARDFCNSKEVLRLADTFLKYLDWQRKDGSPVSPVYLRSASDVRESHFSMRPFEADGVIIHLGSDKNFSTEMYKLQKEVLPLWRLRPCPRNLKRTSVEKYFRSQRFLVDWCSFKLKSNRLRSNNLGDEQSNADNGNSENGAGSDSVNNFHFRSEIPEKSYTGSILLVTIVPGTIGSLIAIIIMGIFWNDEDETMPVFKTQGQPSGVVGVVKNVAAAEGSYQQYHNVPMSGDGDDFFLITGDEGRHDPEEDRRQERATTPQPPQYGNAIHPNGSPALTYAV